MIIYTESVYSAVNAFYSEHIVNISDYIRGTDISGLSEYISYDINRLTFTVKKDFHICELLNVILAYEDENNNAISFNFKIPVIELESYETFDGNNCTITFSYDPRYINDYYNIQDL